MNSYAEIGSIDFLQRLVYVHGFANLPEDVFAATAAFQQLCNRAKQDEVLVIPIVWPCDNDFGIVKDCWDDQKGADQSAYSLARVCHASRNVIVYHASDDLVLRASIAGLTRTMGLRLVDDRLQGGLLRLV